MKALLVSLLAVSLAFGISISTSHADLKTLSAVPVKKGPAKRITSKNGLRISRDQNHYKVSSSQKHQTRSVECGEFPRCDPRPANDCREFVKTCYPSVYCSNVDWEEWKEIDPEIKPALFTKS